ncbi:MAG: efflux RND transporter periplasmic adaptor subunit [Bacteroidota bacterium]
MFLKNHQQLFLIISLSILISCGNKSQQTIQGPPPAIPVVLDTAKTTNAFYYDEYPGSVVALNQVELRPQVSGFITGVHFTDGSHVRKGQLLYSIDQQLYSANYQQAVANLNVQEANLAKAQKDADRYHELDKNDAVAKQLVDNADAALEVAKRQVQASKANIRGVQTNVRYTRVTAPFDGTIGISNVKVGAAVTAGQTILNTVSTDNPLAVDFNIDQAEIFRFTSMLQQPAKASDSTFTLAFNGQPYAYPGKIVLLDRAVNPQTGTIKMRLSFPNTQNMLRSGMNTTVRVKNNTSTQSVVIPNKAVVEQLGEFFVYTLADSSKVTQRKLVLGKTLGPDIIVKDGLKEGDVFVVQGVQNLREGVVVTTAPPATPTTQK